MDIGNINPFIRFCDRRNFCSDYTDFVVAYDYRIFYIATGALTFICDNSKTILNSYSLVLLPPRTRYKFESLSETETTFYVLNFDLTYDHSNVAQMAPDFVNQYDNSKTIIPPIVQPFDKLVMLNSVETLNEKFKLIHKRFIEKNKYYCELSSATLKDILVHIASFCYSKSKASPKMICETMSYIKQHYKENISNIIIGDALGYHSYYLNRRFFEYTGTTIHQYICDLRLKEARRLLTSTNLPISDIIEDVGFMSVSYFSKAFKNKFGITPSQCRKNRKPL